MFSRGRALSAETSCWSSIESDLVPRASAPRLVLTRGDQSHSTSTSPSLSSSGAVYTPPLLPPAPPSAPLSHSAAADLARGLADFSLSVAATAAVVAAHGHSMASATDGVLLPPLAAVTAGAPAARARVMNIPSLVLAVIFLFFAVMTDFASAARQIHAFTLKDEAGMRTRHNTQYFRSGQYVLVRRGGEMAMAVTLDSPLDAGQSLSVYIAPASIFLPSSLRINHISGNQYEVQAQVDPNAPVGLCSVSIRLSDQQNLIGLPRQVAVLFNPWHPQDQVFYPNTAELTEYINNEHGITYRGNNVNVQSVRWYYAQFSHEAVLAVMHHLNKLGINERRDPVAVIRFFSAIMTPQPSHPDGILVGRWDRTYPGGMNPSAWQGSDQILRHYVATGFNGVKYGQCWVFGALLNTLGRAAGIPMRQVSNFDSAHETPVAPETYNQEILRYWDRNSRRMVAEVGMIWNFHSWNEAWMDNRIAGGSFNGPQWNVVDGTPQELSEDKYQLGPASIRAVFAGAKPRFDASFVLSEVSSRIHNYAVACPFIPWGKLTQLPPQCTIIRDMGREARFPTGTIVVTKLPGLQNFGANTITSTYHARGGPIANAGPVFSSGVPTPGLPMGMRFSRFSVYSGDEEDAGDRAAAARASARVASGRSSNSYIEPSAFNGAVDDSPERIDDEHNAMLFDFDESGLAISITIPPVKLGEPIVLWVNLACADRTEDFVNSMRSRDRARNFITFDDSGEDSGSRSDSTNNREREHVKCPEELDLSLNVDLVFSDYTGAERGRVGTHSVDVSLRPTNGHFESFRFEAADYLPKPDGTGAESVEEYVRASVMAVDLSTRPGEEITLVASNSMGFVLPRLTLATNQTVLRTERRRNTRIDDSSVVSDEDSELLKSVVFDTLVSTPVTANVFSEIEEEELVVDVASTGRLSFSTLAAAVNTRRNRHGDSASDDDDEYNGRFARPGVDREQEVAALVRIAEAAAVAHTDDDAETHVEVQIMFKNELSIPLTGVTLRLSADNLGFEETIVELQPIPAGSSLIHTHTFDAELAIPGPHYYHAVLLTNELPPIVGEAPFMVDVHAYVTERRDDLTVRHTSAGTGAANTAAHHGRRGRGEPEYEDLSERFSHN